jgi:hypothetical protein
MYGRKAILALVSAALLAQPGCGTLGEIADNLPDPLLPITGFREPIPNPIFIPNGDFETIWKQSVVVLDDYFDIASEDRLARRIETQPEIAATIVEPWLGNSVTIRDRIEASLQTMRRVAFVTINPVRGGGYTVKVEVFKELEDMIKPDRQAAGRAAFQDNISINRTNEIVGPYPLPLGWIRSGRDPQLEYVILNRIKKSLGV